LKASLKSAPYPKDGKAEEHRRTACQITAHRIPKLIGGQCYQFSCYLARSNSYLSGTTYNSDLKERHNKPIKLRILGANTFRGDSTILYQSPTIKHTEWKEYTIKLKPKKDYAYLILQAYYVTPVLFPYIGNVLVDNCSTIEWVSCDRRSKPLAKKKHINEAPKKPKAPENEEITQPKTNKKPKTSPPTPKTPKPPKTENEVTKTPPPTPTPKPTPDKNTTPEKPKPESLAQLEAASIVEGLVMQVKNINFAKFHRRRFGDAGKKHQLCQKINGTDRRLYGFA